MEADFVRRNILESSNRRGNETGRANLKKRKSDTSSVAIYRDVIKVPPTFNSTSFLIFVFLSELEFPSISLAPRAKFGSYFASSLLYLLAIFISKYRIRSQRTRDTNNEERWKLGINSYLRGWSIGIETGIIVCMYIKDNILNQCSIEITTRTMLILNDAIQARARAKD